MGTLREALKDSIGEFFGETSFTRIVNGQIIGWCGVLSSFDTVSGPPRVMSITMAIGGFVMTEVGLLQSIHNSSRDS